MKFRSISLILILTFTAMSIPCAGWGHELAPKTRIRQFIMKPASSAISQGAGDNRFLVIYGDHWHRNSLTGRLERIRKELGSVSVDPATGRKKAMIVLESIFSTEDVLRGMMVTDLSAYLELIQENQEAWLFSDQWAAALRNGYRFNMERMRESQRSWFWEDKPIPSEFRARLAPIFGGFLLELCDFAQRERIFAMNEEPSFEGWLNAHRAFFCFEQMQNDLVQHNFDRFRQNAERFTKYMVRSEQLRDASLAQLVQNFSQGHPGWLVATMRGGTHINNDPVIRDLSGFKTEKIIDFDPQASTEAFRLYEAHLRGEPLPYESLIKYMIEKTLDEFRVRKTGDSTEMYRFVAEVIRKIQEKEGLQRWFERVVEEFNWNRIAPTLQEHLQNALVQEGYIHPDDLSF